MEKREKKTIAYNNLMHCTHLENEPWLENLRVAFQVSSNNHELISKSKSGKFHGSNFYCHQSRIRTDLHMAKEFWF